ncbi:hypothetical protein VMCG_03631 [Cytospora schulzeri]|uniref:SET domain-containing protein n=1 Tax=Cytospora schulzeri TaxID=448051 RepID=A0A423WWE3_9PEZI|nr:hypothetical protein VMCG_03631 [Valsa malicola]
MVDQVQVSEPSSTELCQQYMTPQVLVCNQADDGCSSLDGHDNLTKAYEADDDNGATGSAPRLDQVDSLVKQRTNTPNEAKVSVANGDYYADTKPENGRKDENNECPDVTASAEKEIAKQQPGTNVEYRVIQRPIDTCLGQGWTRGDDALPPNRTFANEFIIVKKSPLHGYGIFAAVDIEEKTHILVEKPFFIISAWKQLDSEYARLNEEEKAVFDGLVGYSKEHEDAVSKKHSANNFVLPNRGQIVLAIASNINHACPSRRNTDWAWDNRCQVMTFTATKDIKKDQEVLISYSDRRSTLYSLYGFICHCGSCENQAYNND